MTPLTLLRLNMLMQRPPQSFNLFKHLTKTDEGPLVAGEPLVNVFNPKRSLCIKCLRCHDCGKAAVQHLEEPMTLDELIDIADGAYDDGLVRQYFEDPDENHGDTLAEFVVHEISDTFDPDLPREKQIAEAIRLMTSAIRQLQDVVSALEEAEGVHFDKKDLVRC